MKFILKLLLLKKSFINTKLEYRGREAKLLNIIAKAIKLKQLGTVTTEKRVALCDEYKYKRMERRFYSPRR